MDIPALQFNERIALFFHRALRFNHMSFHTWKNVWKIAYWQKIAQVRRIRQCKHGVHVPPFMIFSITQRCNLRCKGCYAHALHGFPRNPELFPMEIERIFQQSQDLGMSIALIAGGEPLTRTDLLSITAKFPHMLFPIFTNGTLLTETMVSQLKQQTHIVPILSIEGRQFETDDRRGEGVYSHLMHAISLLNHAQIMFGTSITLTSQNFELVTSDAFLQELCTRGCRVFIFVEYVPVTPGSEELVLRPAQKAKLNDLTLQLQEKYQRIFIAFPGDEERLGGCLAAGRGFVHINSHGGVEACPFAPYSDFNLRNASLEDALKSRTLTIIRTHHDLFGHSSSGCALWEHREQIEALLKSEVQSV